MQDRVVKNSPMQVKITIYFIVLATNSAREFVWFFTNTVDSKMDNLKLSTFKLWSNPG